MIIPAQHTFVVFSPIQGDAVGPFASFASAANVASASDRIAEHRQVARLGAIPTQTVIFYSRVPGHSYWQVEAVHDDAPRGSDYRRWHKELVTS